MRYQDVNLTRLDGGINTASPPNQIEDNEFVQALNLEWDDEGNLTSRLGVEKIGGGTPTVASFANSVDVIFDGVSRMFYDPATKRLYVGNDLTTDSVTIVDVSIPANPQFLSVITHASLSSPQGMAVVGDYLYVCSRVGTAILVFDVSDPTAPTYVTSYSSAYTDEPYDCVLSGNYLYVVNDDFGGFGAVIALDVSTPSSPSLASQVTGTATGYFIAHNSDNNRVYVTNQDTDSVLIFDVTTPTAISHVITFTDATYLNGCNGVSAEGDNVYIGCSVGNMVTIMDATNEVTFTRHGSITDASRLDGVAGISRSGSILAAAVKDSDFISILNVSDVTDPQIIVDMHIPGIMDQVNSVCLVDDIVYFGCAGTGTSDNLGAVQIGTPKPFSITDQHAGPTMNQLDLKAISPNGNYMVVNDWSGDRVVCFDIQDPADLKQRDTQSFAPSYSPDYIGGIAFNAAGDRLYIWGSTNAGGRGCLHICSFNQSTGLIESISELETTSGGGYGNVAIIDTTTVVVVAQTPENIMTFDVENDAATLLDTYTWTTESPEWVVYNSATKTAYIQGNGNIGIFDLNDTSAIGLVDSIVATSDKSLLLDTARNYLFAIDSATTSTIFVWDISDQTTLTAVDQISPPVSGGLGDIYYDASSKRLYGACVTSDALIVINTTDIYNMVQEYLFVDSTNLNGANTVYYDGDGNAFVGTLTELVAIKAEISADFDLLFAIKQIPLNGAYGVAVWGQKAIVASDVSDSIAIFDISDADRPVQLGYLVDATNLNGAKEVVINSTGTVAFVAASGNNGIAAIDISNPASPSVLSTVVSATALASVKYLTLDSDDAFLYCGVHQYLTVVDVRETGAISIVSAVKNTTKYANLSGFAWYSDRYLVGQATSYLLIWDVNYPFAPSIKGFLNDAKLSGHNISLSGNYVYHASDSGNSLEVFDISTLTAPVHDNTVSSLTAATGVHAVEDDEIVWITSQSAGTVWVYDIATPTAPSLIASATLATAVGAEEITATGFDCYIPSNTLDSIVVARLTGLQIRSDVTSIFQFKNEFDVDELIVTEGKNLYKQNADLSYEPMQGSLTLPTGNTWEWAVLDGILYGVNGGDAASFDNPVYWDGETTSFVALTAFPTTVVTGQPAIIPSSCAVWNSRLFIAHGNVLRWSKLGDGTDWTDLTSGSLEVNPNDGDEIVKIVPHKGVLVIFKRNRIYRLIPGAPNTATAKWSVEPVTESMGLISKESVVPVMNDLAFMSKSGYASLVAADQIGDFSPAMLSKKIGSISDLVDGKYPAVRVEGSEQVWLTTDEDGDGTLDTVWVMDYEKVNDGMVRWTKFNGLTVGTAYGIVEESGVNRLYIGGSGALYRLKISSDSNLYRDDTVGFETTLKTKEYDSGAPLYRKEIERIGFDLEKITSALTVTAKIYFDGAASADHTFTFNAGSLSTGDFVVWRKVVGSAGRRHRRLQIELTDSTIDEGWSINGMTFRLAMLTRRLASDL